MTAQGSAYMRFRRALDRGNATEALSSAAELPHVGVAEALELCLLVLDRQPARYGRLALRWHARYCGEHRTVGLEEAQMVLAALAVIPTPRGGAAARSLAELLDRRGLERAAEALVRWSREER